MKSVTVWMCVSVFLLLLDDTVSSWGGSSVLSTSLANNSPGSSTTVSGSEPQPEWVDCVQASELCNQNPHCSSRYRVMRQCLVGKEKDSMLDTNRECQAALEVLLVSPLYDCRCKRGMKKELQCLQSYWSIHMGLTEGEEFYETSPYEPVAPVRHPDAFRLASISSGMHTVALKGLHCPDAGKPCNPCLDAAKACNLNSVCKKQRSTYISTCSKGDHNKGETCNRKRCHKALRQFLDRVPTEFSHRLLFCPCQHEGCSERRRQTIVPDCSFKDKVIPNCLELRRVCRQDPLCRSRLADFHMNCLETQHTVSSCPNEDNYQACLAPTRRLIGTDMTPNYVDSSYSNWTVSPWCTCKGSGNQEEECVNFLHDFTKNTCLRNAIQAFGYGADNMQNKDVSISGSSVTAKARMDGSTSTSEPPDISNGIKPGNEVLGKPLVEPSSGYGGLSPPQVQPEDQSACLCASIWALFPTLALALILAQHAL
ncbi:GDNF family receptor alpha-2-like [Thalassophryne amazonica]|uniref:GDNF family receptor alpha-2-like n=1 Tax=Thalassophryne amazonica TaxID=390379 RepID=UPI001471FE9D|nr:GDNF family receptor alpha-2-like [Thalassophryne amazonica]